MTAIDPRARALPGIGQYRFVRDVRTGWHALIDGQWRYVLDAIRAHDGKNTTLILREGLNGERDVPMASTATLATRTPAEQIQWIEAQRVNARGGGPVSRLHLDQETQAVLGGLPRCPQCGAPTYEQEAGA